LPDGNAAISSVTMSSGTGLPYVPVTGGSSNPGDEAGVQLGGAGGDCATDLEIAGSSGVVFTAAGVSTSGCSTQSAAARMVAALRFGLRARASSDGATSSTGAIQSAGTIQPSGIPGAGSQTAQTLSGGSFDSTVPPSGAPYRITVQGGTYLSELDGTVQPITFTITAIIDSTSSLPPVLPITPLSELITGSSSGLMTTPVIGVAEPPAQLTAAMMAAYGFPTGTIALQIVPNFGSSVGEDDAPLAGSILSDLESELVAIGPTDQGSLSQALLDDIADGVFDGKPTGQPAPLGSASLPPIAGTTLFPPSPIQFLPISIPPLPPIQYVGGGPTQPLPVPVPPIAPAPLAAITRVGPAAFTETLVANTPALAQAPFSATSDSFVIEVVANS
jgi:hypothetical protein